MWTERVWEQSKCSVVVGSDVDVHVDGTQLAGNIFPHYRGIRHAHANGKCLAKTCFHVEIACLIKRLRIAFIETWWNSMLCSNGTSSEQRAFLSRTKAVVQDFHWNNITWESEASLSRFHEFQQLYWKLFNSCIFQNIHVSQAFIKPTVSVVDNICAQLRFQLAVARSSHRMLYEHRFDCPFGRQSSGKRDDEIDSCWAATFEAQCETRFNGQSIVQIESHFREPMLFIKQCFRCSF